MTARPPSATSWSPHDVAIVGNDLLLRALPAQPVQVAHAVAVSGYEFVVPVSWGEELVAEAALQRLALAGSSAGPQVFCCCPRVRARLLAPGHELAPHLLSLVAPPVALARYLREHTPGLALRITYIGACDGGRDPAIDRQIHPADFLRELAASGIELAEQPTTFSDVIPPDRRRHWSLPGGCPSPEAVREHTSLEDVTFPPGPEVAHDIVDAILRREPVLLDVAAPLSCACAGAITVGGATGSRQAIVSREPPRAHTSIIDGEQLAKLEYRISTGTAYAPPQPLDVHDVVPAKARSHESGTIALVDSRASFDAPPELEEDTVLATPRLTTRPRIAVTPPGVAVEAAREEPQLSEPPAQPLPKDNAFIAADPPLDPGASTAPVVDAPSAPAVVEPMVAEVEPRREGRRWRHRHGSAPRVTPAGRATIPRAFAALRDRQQSPAYPAGVIPPAEAPAREETAEQPLPISEVVLTPVAEQVESPPPLEDLPIATPTLREPPATHSVGVVPPAPCTPRPAPRVVIPAERSRPWPTILLVIVLVVLVWVIMRTLSA